MVQLFSKYHLWRWKRSWKPCIHLQRWYFEKCCAISVKEPEQRWWLENYVSISRDDTLKNAAASLSRSQRWWLENHVTISRDDTMKNAAPSLSRSQRWWLENYVSISRDDTLINAAPSLRDASLKNGLSSLWRWYHWIYATISMEMITRFLIHLQRCDHEK